MAEADYCRPVVLRSRLLRLELLSEDRVEDLTAAAQDDRGEPHRGSGEERPI